jgi:hypothetical protein
MQFIKSGFGGEQLVFDQLLAQRVAVQAQPLGGADWLWSACCMTTSSSGFSTTRPSCRTCRRARCRAGRGSSLQAVAHALFDVFLAHAWWGPPWFFAVLGARIAAGAGKRSSPSPSSSKKVATRATARRCRPAVHAGAKGLAAGQRAHIPADVLARAAHAGEFAVQARSGPAGGPAAARRTSATSGGARSVAGGQEVRDLAEDPGPALRGAADHHGVGAGGGQHLARLAAGESMSPLATTGMRSAALTAATVSCSASPGSPARACGRAP